MASMAALKVVTPFGAFRTVFNSNRCSLLGHQQNAGLRQATKEKMKELNIPDKPKKPMSAYFRFVKDRREDLLKDNPKMKLMDLSKQCAKEWATVHIAVREKYNAEYKKEKESYNKLNTEYESKLSEEQREFLQKIRQDTKHNKQKRELRKKQKEEHKPKRPVGPYMQFVVEQLKKGESLTGTLPKIVNRWHSLPDSEKQKYKVLYEQDKKRYDHEMRQWEQKMIKEGKEDMIRNSAKPKVSVKSRILDKKPSKDE